MKKKMQFFQLLFLVMFAFMANNHVNAEEIPWYHQKINVKEAWGLGFTGKGIGVAVIDGGIGTMYENGVIKHEDLIISGGANCYDLTTFGNCTSNYEDNLDHGTHVGGIIAAQHNANNVNGIAPNVNLLSVRNSFNRGSTPNRTLAALNWIKDNREKYNIKIVNISQSWSNDGSKEQQEIIDKFQELIIGDPNIIGDEILVVAAAGNDGTAFPSNDNMGDIPTKIDGVIVVSATDEYDSRAYLGKDDKGIDHYSSTGPNVDVTSPGKEIYSTIPTDSNGNKYAFMSGTSMAAPMVSGILALYMEMYPEKSTEEIKHLLFDSAIEIGTYKNPNDGWNWEFGHGLVQALPEKPIAINKNINLKQNAVVYDNPSLQANADTIESKTYLTTRAWKKNEKYSYLEYEWYEITDEDGNRFWVNRENIITSIQGNSLMLFYNEPIEDNLYKSPYTSSYFNTHEIVEEIEDWLKLDTKNGKLWIRKSDVGDYHQSGFKVYIKPGLKAYNHPFEDRKELNIVIPDGVYDTQYGFEQTGKKYPNVTQQNYAWHRLMIDGQVVWVKQEALQETYPNPYVYFSNKTALHLYPHDESNSQYQTGTSSHYVYYGYDYNEDEKGFNWYGGFSSNLNNGVFQWYKKDYDAYKPHNPDVNGFTDGVITSWDDYIGSDLLRNDIENYRSHPTLGPYLEESNYFTEEEYNEIMTTYASKYSKHFVVRIQDSGKEKLYLAFANDDLTFVAGYSYEYLRTHNDSKFTLVFPTVSSNRNSYTVHETSSYGFYVTSKSLMKFDIYSLNDIKY